MEVENAIFVITALKKRKVVMEVQMRYLSCRHLCHEFHPTPLIRPIFFGPFMTVLTGFLCKCRVSIVSLLETSQLHV